MTGNHEEAIPYYRQACHLYMGQKRLDEMNSAIEIIQKENGLDITVEDFPVRIIPQSEKAGE
jgi:hypothetical protein